MNNPEEYGGENLGWIKLHRKSLDSWVFADPKTLKIWIWCLLKASHSGDFVPLTVGKGSTTVKLMPGSFIYGRNKASKELHIAGSTIDRKIEQLESHGNIKRKTGSHYSIITICNWGLYQKANSKSEQPTGRQRTGNEQPTGSERTTDGQPMGTYNNANNDENDKIDEIVKPLKRYIPTLEEVIEYFDSKGYTKEHATKVFDYYQLSIEDTPGAIYWKDKNGKNIKRWKMKVQIWMKEEGKKQVYDSEQPVSQAKNDGEVFTMNDELAGMLAAAQEKFAQKNAAI
jgi:hypothetical protein